MKKHTKQAVAFTLSALLLAGVMTGCAQTPASSAASASSQAATSEDNSKTITFPYKGDEVVFKGFGYDGLPQEETVCSKAWQEHVGNIKVEWELIPYSDYQTKTQVYLSSGEIPDILPTADIQKVAHTYGAEGTLLDFNKYQEYMPNLQEYRKTYPNMDYLNTTDGNRFAIIGVQPIDFAGESWFVNMDMLKKAGITEAPNNLEELLADMRAVKAADSASVPFQSYWNIAYTMTTFARLLGAKDSLTYYDTAAKAFKFTYSEPDAKRKELIQLMADMYKEGLINSEIQTMSFEQEQNTLAQGQWAFSFLYQNSPEKEIFKVERGEALPFNIQPMTAPADSTGVRTLPLAYQHDSIPGWGIVCSSATKNPELLAAYMDQVVSPFGRDIFNYGVEGVTYDKKDGQYVMKTDIDKTAMGVGTQYEVWMVGMGPTSRDGDGYTLCQNAIDLNLANFKSGKVSGKVDPVFATFSSEAAETKANLENTLKTYVDENEAMFIYGLRNMSEWDAYVEEVKGIIDVNALLALYNEADLIQRDPNRIYEVK